MKGASPFFRPLVAGLIVVMTAISAYGFYSIRSGIDDLKGIERDNLLWSSIQIEIEFLRFQRALAVYAVEQTQASAEVVQERYDILLSRFSLANSGRVGEAMRRFDDGFGTLDIVLAFLRDIDPVIQNLSPGRVPALNEILARTDELQSELRFYSHRAVRADTAAASLVRERMQAGTQRAGTMALVALLLCSVSLILIARDNRRQRHLAAMNLRQAQAAEAASQAKSRFLSMMSHELRNPLNGILGPLALVGQSELGDKQARLVERAQQSGRIMLRMLAGLLDYGDVEDGRLVLKEEVFRPAALTNAVAAALADALPAASRRVDVSLGAGMPDMVWGDLDRLTQVFTYMTEYLMAPDGPAELAVGFSHDGENLIGDIVFPDSADELRWKLDLLVEIGGDSRRSFSADALGVLIGRGLIGAMNGVLTLDVLPCGRRRVRVSVPARKVAFKQIRIYVETKSAALATLYRVALKSDRVAFMEHPADGAADVVLVDSTSVGDGAATRSLRTRFPRALLVSLGSPAMPGVFDDIVEGPADLGRLRTSVLGRLIS